MANKPLSTRETEILALLAEGLSNKEIGLRLGLKVSTVRGHVESIFAKLGVASRTEAARTLWFPDDGGH